MKLLEGIKRLRERGLRVHRVQFCMLASAAVLGAGLLYTIRVGRRTLLSGREPDPAEVERLLALMDRQEALTIALLAVGLLMFLVVLFLAVLPLEHYIDRMKAGQTLRPMGGQETRYLANAYNAAYQESKKHNDHLIYQAEHDPLTKLYNRRAFDQIRAAHENERVGLMLIDVDRFKEVNDTWGHGTGDRVLQKIAEVLSGSFRATDYPCRIGGDEFAVVCTGVTPTAKEVLRRKVREAAAKLRDTSDGLPAVTLSVGVAFGEQIAPGEDLYRMADAALYQVKAAGRDGCGFYGETYPPEEPAAETREAGQGAAV